MTGALEELQEAGYIHGDIKPDNFVIQGMVDHTLNFTISRNRL
jgi:serine/threonine protein kinase